MLSPADFATYRRDGFIVLPDILTRDEVAALRSVTDEFVRNARTVVANDDIYDLEDSHSAADPRVRRIKTPHLHHPEYARAARHPKILEVLADLWGTVRFDTGKLNMKSAGYGAPVMVIPGSHLGPVYDHHGPDGRFCGALDPDACGLDLSPAVPCLGKAGSITVHHVRAVHGSATNFSGQERRFLLFQYRAADAWPLLGFAGGIEKFDELLLAGEPTLTPRLAPVPVRLPLPPAEHQGSIYENQRATGRRFFETTSDRQGDRQGLAAAE
jgi:phytanoyl-CoA hydroxylase